LTKGATIGAGVDSVYEYMWKAHLLFGDTMYLDMFEIHLKAIYKWLRKRNGLYYSITHMDSGGTWDHSVDALSAFWPGVLATYGLVADAEKLWQLFWEVHQRFQFLPERFSLIKKNIEWGG
jgi:mannosidase alpha-like ER degradation enhancer 1